MVSSAPAEPPYRDREVVLSTKHGKERAIGPPLRARLGVHLRVPTDVDTDRLGTFTGEVARVGTPLQVAVRKARLGMAATGLPLGLANEGSFGPHPGMPFVPADHELLLFVDDELGIQVAVETLSAETNFAHADAATVGALGADFLRQARFPSHGLIVRPNAGPEYAPLIKGITTAPALLDAVERCARASSDGLAHLETDMRAHMNPMRQAVLRALAKRMAQQLATRCPACATPGWGAVGVVRGLPCEVCGGETALVREEIHGCPRCEHRSRLPRGDGRRHADPGHCPWCNP